MNRWSVGEMFKSFSTNEGKSSLFSHSARVFYSMVFAAPILLAGCKSTIANNGIEPVKASALTDIKVLDFRTTDCAKIWQNEDLEALENPLFWLRAMDCAERLNRKQARMKASGYTSNSWSNALKQGVLLSNGEKSANELRQMLSTVNKHNQNIPNSLRPLLQMWRDTQTSKLAVIEERRRYQTMIANADAKFDALKDQESRLKYKLDETTRKLSSLTDIERQLSSRKQLQSELPAESEKSAKEPESTVAKPVKPAEKSEGKDEKVVETKVSAETKAGDAAEKENAKPSDEKKETSQ